LVRPPSRATSRHEPAAGDPLARHAAELAALYAFTDRMHRATSLEQVYASALDVIQDALRCERASILLADADGVMRFVAWRGLSDGYRQAVEGHSPWRIDDPDPKPIGVDDVREAGLGDELTRVIDREGIRACSFVPLVDNGRLIGKFMVYYEAPHAFDAAELALGLTIGRQLAYAVERARADEQRLRAERALRASETRLRAIVDRAAVGIVLMDLDGRLLEVNPRLCRMLGRTPEDLLAHRSRELTHPDDVQAEESMTAEVSEGARSEFSIEKRYRRGDGGWLWVNVSVTALEDTAGRVHRLLAVVEDIEARRHAEQALRDDDRHKDEFLAMLAHELRNPLAPIASALEVMRRAGDGGAMVAQSREIAERQLRHVVRLVDDLLDVSRITRNRLELRRERVDVGGVVQHAVEACRPAIDAAGHTLAVELPRAPIAVDADPARLVQVLDNLLTNAIRYTPRGGRVALSVEPGAGDVAIRVADTGIGIPPDMLARVFEMFTQVEREPERAQGGLGIGLSLVRWLVELHGGTVTAASPGAGCGSTFTVRLPLATAAPQPGRGVAAAPRVATGLRVLVADDNADGADSLARVLELDGHVVSVAHDGEQAIAAAREFGADAVLLDIGMPRLDGFAACRAIRAAAGTQPPLMIAVTGWGQDQDRTRARDAGFDVHLVKPVDLKALGALLAEYGAGRPA